MDHDHGKPPKECPRPLLWIGATCNSCSLIAKATQKKPIWRAGRRRSLELYERDWAVAERSRVGIREHLESGSEIRAEITIEATINGHSAVFEGALTHRWSEGKLVRSRLYTDPLPPEVAAVQPPGGTDS